MRPNQITTKLQDSSKHRGEATEQNAVLWGPKETEQSGTLPDYREWHYTHSHFDKVQRQRARLHCAARLLQENMAPAQQSNSASCKTKTKTEDRATTSEHNALNSSVSRSEIFQLNHTETSPAVRSSGNDKVSLNLDSWNVPPMMSNALKHLTYV